MIQVASMAMGEEFKGRTALVTGGSRGIGRAVCLKLAEQGARVAVNFRADEKAAQETAGALRAAGAEALTVQADVSDPAEVDRMTSEVEKVLGPVDLLVSCAGIVQVAEHSEMDFDAWRRMMRINIDGTYLPVMAVKDGMIARGYGRIVCLASIAALRPRSRMIAYSTSKAAVVAFARSCAEAFGPAVRINCVAPGLIETDMAAGMDAKLKQAMVDNTYLKRIGQPQEMAEMVSFLLSERSSFTTGQTYVADGGRVTLP